MTYARMLVEMVRARGVDIRDLLDKTGLRPEQLQQVDERIGAAAMMQLIRNALSLTADSSLGLRFGAQLKLSAHGFLGYAAMSSDTLEEALQLGVKYFRTRFGLLDLHFYIEGEHAFLALEPTLPLGDTGPFILDSFMSAFTTMGENLLGSIPSGVSSSWVLQKSDHHESFFSGTSARSISYGAQRNLIRFPAALLSQRLVFSDASSRQLAEEQCKKELAMLEESESIIARVRQILVNSGQRFPKLEVVAEQCFMSARTFKRRLQSVGTSFQEILDDIRKSQAVEYLRSTTKPIDEIAALLGYNDPSNFGRAFKRWTGQTPSQYRHQNELVPSYR